MRPLFGVTVAIWALLALAPATVQGSAGSSQVTIGLLLLAIDVQRDHVRVSEALRISNAGPRVDAEIAFPLPPAAQYVTFHRGLVGPKETPTGFVDRLHLPPGVSEVAYSYALATGGRAVLNRAFPFPVQRLEIAMRGEGSLVAMQGQPLPPLTIGDQKVQRWEVHGLPAGKRVTLVLDGLPISRPWMPAAVTLGLAVALAAGLIAALRRQPHLPNLPDRPNLPNLTMRH